MTQYSGQRPADRKCGWNKNYSCKPRYDSVAMIFIQSAFHKAATRFHIVLRHSKCEPEGPSYIVCSLGMLYPNCWASIGRCTL